MLTHNKFTINLLLFIILSVCSCKGKTGAAGTTLPIFNASDLDGCYSYREAVIPANAYITYQSCPDIISCTWQVWTSNDGSCSGTSGTPTVSPFPLPFGIPCSLANIVSGFEAQSGIDHTDIHLTCM